MRFQRVVPGAILRMRSSAGFLALTCAIATGLLVASPRAVHAGAADSAPLALGESLAAPLDPSSRSTRVSLAQAVDGVFGVDEREPVLSTLSGAARMTTLILVEFPSKTTATCSGFMVGPRTVGTAGHCVYNRAEGGWITSALVVPAANRVAQPFGQAWATESLSVSGWVRAGDPRLDFGALTLESSLGDSTGVFGMRVEDDATLTSVPFAITGYPGDKPFATMWRSTGRITAVDARRLYFSIDVTYGNSGGPVWGQTTGDQYIVLGIVEGGNNRTNNAIRMTQSLIDQFASWRERAAGGAPPAPAPSITPAIHSVTTTPVVVRGAAGARARSLLTIRAVEGGGNLIVTTAGGSLIANAALSPKSCGGGTAACVDTSGDQTAILVVPDAGNDLGTVLLTLEGAINTSKVVTVTVAQGGVTWTAGLHVVAEVDGVLASPAPSPSTPPVAASGAAGGFATTPVFSASRLAQAVFLGGTVEQLDSALRASDASGAWAQSPDGGFVLYVAGGGFVNGRFRAAFPGGFPTATALTLVRK